MKLSLLLGLSPPVLALRGLPARQDTTTATATTTTASVTGALNASSVGTAISTLPANAAATSYPSDGQLQSPQPAPFVPAGGMGTNGSEPVYSVRSDYDYESVALALYETYLELALLRDGLARFSETDFRMAGLNASDRALIELMASQDEGHAVLLTNLLGARQAPRACAYSFAYTGVCEFVGLCQRLTRAGESGLYGFLPHLDSREAAMLLLQAVATHARQQMAFRQLEGLFPMPVWFEVAIPQSWLWTLIAPHISACPANETRLAWQNFPALWILNQPGPANASAAAAAAAAAAAGGGSGNATANSTTPGSSCKPAIASSRLIPLSHPGRRVLLAWDPPGKPVGPNSSYLTSTASTGQPRYVAWVSQLNVTYSPLTVTNSTHGWTTQPDMASLYGAGAAGAAGAGPAINGSMFVAVTDSDLAVTPFNISMLNPHVLAGPAVYQAG